MGHLPKNYWNKFETLKTFIINADFKRNVIINY